MEIHLVRFLIKHGIIPLFTSFFQNVLYQKCCKNTEIIVFSQNKKFGLLEIISRCTLPNMKVCRCVELEISRAQNFLTSPKKSQNVEIGSNSLPLPPVGARNLENLEIFKNKVFDTLLKSAGRSCALAAPFSNVSADD